MSYRYSNADEKLKRAVWSKGSPIEGYSPDEWRRDKCGHAMKYALHGSEVEFGWEIDHIKPVAKGGSDELANLQPLFWRTNREKGDNYPWSCS